MRKAGVGMRWLKSLLFMLCGVFSLCAAGREPPLSLNVEETDSQDRSESREGQTDVAREDYQFIGRHMVASYCGCDQHALHDLDGLRAAFSEAVKVSGARLLKLVEHIFPPDGMTVLALLSESHASIHTYPEHRACFVDIFTCGLTCRAEEFDNVMRRYLRPASSNQRIFLRHYDIDDDNFCAEASPVHARVDSNSGASRVKIIGRASTWNSFNSLR